MYLENHSLGEWFIGRLLSIIEAEVCPDHIHMLVEIPPKYSVSNFMGYLKGKSSLMIYEKYPELKYKYRNREFWCRGYYVDTTGKSAKKIEEYKKHQLDEDKAGKQMTIILWKYISTEKNSCAPMIMLFWKSRRVQAVQSLPLNLPIRRLRIPANTKTR